MKRRIFCGVLITVSLLVFFSYTTIAETYSTQTTTFINVGQGDSALLEDGNGYEVLIDGGKKGAGPTVAAFLNQKQITDLEVMALSHPDADHLGGLISVLEENNIRVDQIIYGGYPGSSATWNEFAAQAEARGLSLTAVQFPSTLQWGEMTVYVLNPPGGLANPDTNEAALVLLVSHGSVDYLFPADIDSNIEADVLARQTPVAAEVLKVAHHGSDLSSSSGFLGAVQPKEAVISVGDNNSYGHPGEETLQRLRDAGARIWRTDRDGNVVVQDDGSSYRVLNPAAGVAPVLYFPLTAH